VRRILQRAHAKNADFAARLISHNLYYVKSNSKISRREPLSKLDAYDQGFPDPTKAPVVRKVLRGIQALHPAQEKQAKPLQLDVLTQVDTWLEEAIANARSVNDRGSRAAASPEPGAIAARVLAGLSCR
jgi:hypothetical protein